MMRADQSSWPAGCNRFVYIKESFDEAAVLCQQLGITRVSLVGGPPDRDGLVVHQLGPAILGNIVHCLSFDPSDRYPGLPLRLSSVFVETNETIQDDQHVGFANAQRLLEQRIVAASAGRLVINVG